jgi:hypothetical protein
MVKAAKAQGAAKLARKRAAILSCSQVQKDFRFH